MGNTFKYISDKILREFSGDDVCYWCNEQGPLYKIFIEDEAENRAVNNET